MSPEKKSSAPQPRLIIISAPSGAGKTTLCDLLRTEFPNITLSISCTTRPKRPGEIDGVHYHYLTTEEFKKKVNANDFAEWAEVHGNLYGTSKAVIEDALKSGKHVLFDIDVQGAMSLKRIYRDRTLLIFIHPPSLEELEQRLTARQKDARQVIETRLQNAYNELEWSKSFTYQIVNDNLERAYQELRSIVQKECL